MAHKKYIKRGNKLFGPYFYENYREGGIVKTRYLGKGSEKRKERKIINKKNINKNLFLIVGISVLIILFFLSYSLFFSGLTGRASLQVDSSYSIGENIDGNLKLRLKQGELIPASTKIIVDNSGEISEYLLSDLISEELVSNLKVTSGNFYIEDKSISGEGEGYGVLGEKKIYPIIDFELKLKKEKGENAEVDTSEDNGVINGEEDVSSEIDESVVEDMAPEVVEEISEEEESEPAPITGEVVAPKGVPSSTEEKELSEEGKNKIQGQVSKDNAFVYDLEKGKTAEIKQNSVEVNDEKIGDENVDLEIKEGQAIVSTDYYYTEKGYGEEYLSPRDDSGEPQDVLVINIDLTHLGLIAKDGQLIISLVYDDALKGTSQELASTSEQINVEEPIEEILNITKEPTEEINKTIEQNITEIIEVNITEQINITEIVENITTLQYKAVINRPVKWIKTVKADKDKDLTIELPKKSNNITIKTGEEVAEALNEINDYEDVIGGIDKTNLITGQVTGEVSLDIKKNQGIITRFFKWLSKIGITGNVILEDEIGGNIVETIDSKIINVDEILNENNIIGETDVGIEYYTDAPTAIEENLTNGKRVTISADDEFEYEDILAYSIIEKKISMENVGKIRIYHYVSGEEVAEEEVVNEENKTQIEVEKNVSEINVTEEVEVNDTESGLINESNSESTGEANYSSSITGQVVEGIVNKTEFEITTKNITKQGEATLTNLKKERVKFNAYDLDEDGFVDYVEWIVPHLSEEIYDIIYITEAEHLDENRIFISDIYKELREKDDVWSEVINNSHYVRVTFEKPLDNSKDITIYARSNETSSIEVYAENGSDIIATFEDVSNEDWYKVYLTNLNGTQETFDLKVSAGVGGGVEFDYIVDPNTAPTQSNPFIGAELETPLNESIVGYWKLNRYGNNISSIVLDETGKNNGTPNSFDNTSLSGPTYEGRIGSAWNFDGVDDYVSVPNSNSLDFNTTFTVSAWVNSKGGTWKRILSKGGQNAGMGGFDLMIWSNSGEEDKFAFRIGNITNVFTVYTTNTYAINNWHNVVGMWNGTHILIYVDGVFDKSQSQTTYSNASSYSLLIGRNAAASYQYFNGSIDEVSIWNVSLSSDEILNLYLDGLVNKSETVYTTQDLGVSVNNSDDVDNDNLTSIFNWYEDNVSLAVLNMPFDSNSTYPAKDYSGYNNSGALGNITVSTHPFWNATGGIDKDIPNVFSGAYQFDGVDDYVNVGNDESLNITNAITISAWIYMKAYGTVSNEGMIVSKVYPSYEFEIESNDEIQISINRTKVITTSANIPLNTWTYIVVTYDSSTNSTNLYMNGINQTTTGSVSGAIPSTIYNVEIGNRQVEWSKVPFNGSIDEVQIFNRSLSAEQIKQLYLKNYNILVSEETTKGKSYKAEVTVNDGTEDSLSYNTTSITILNTAPINPTPTLNSTLGTNLTTENLTCYDTLSDIDADAMNVSVQWFKDDALTLTIDYNNTYANATAFNATLTSANTSSGEVWKCGLRFYDGESYTNWVNSSSLTIANTLPTQSPPWIGAELSTPLDSNIVGYWKLNRYSDGTENKVLDETGINNGTLSGFDNTSLSGPTYEGRIGGGWNFDGVDDYVNVGNDASLNFITGRSYSASFWINLKETGVNQMVINKRGTSGGYYIRVTDIGKIKIANHLFEGVGESIFTISKDEWTHVVVVFNNNTQSFYKNGVEGTSSSGAKILLNDTSTNLKISSENYFNGTIDEVSIWNVSLSATEIMNLYLDGYANHSETVYTTQDLGASVNNSADVDCYDEETEIFTEHGWKYFYELENEKVMTLNQETGKAEYQIPTSKQVYNYSGEMYRIETENGDLLVSPEHKVYVGSQNLDSISLGDKTFTGDNFLSTLSPENIGQFNLRASATYWTSFKCSESDFIDSGKNSENSDLEIKVICSITNSKTSSNSCLDNPDLLRNFSLCFSNSLNRNSGAIKSNLLNKSLNANTLNESPFVNNEERTTLTSTTISILDYKYLCDNEVLILSDNSSTSCSVNSDLETVLCNRAILSNFDLINLPTNIDQSIFGACLINVNSSGILTLISMNQDNDKEYLNLSDFELKNVKDVYLELDEGKELMFLDENNNPIKVLEISKEDYSGLIYDVDVPNDIVLVRRKNAESPRDDSGEPSQGDLGYNVVDNSDSQDKVDNTLIPQGAREGTSDKPSINLISGSDNKELIDNNIPATQGAVIDEDDLIGIWSGNSDNLTSIFNWYEDNVSLMVLNMPFDSNASNNATSTKDYSGRGNHGTIVGATWNSTGGIDKDIPNVFSGAYEFDGVDDYVNISDDSSLDITDAITISAWIKLDKLFVEQPIVLKYGGTTNRAFFLYSQQNANTLRFGISHNGANAIETTTPVIPDTNWHHVAGTFDGTNIISYVDGVAGTPVNSPGSIFSSSANLYIGWGDNFNYYFNGSIDEVQLYNRSLSAEEIKQLYLKNYNILVSEETTKGKTYFAEVTVNDGTEDSLSYNTSEISVLNSAPTTPVLNLPANNTNHSLIVPLNWTNSTDADGDAITYYLEVDNNSAFSSVEYTNTSITEATITGDTPTGLIDGTYYWRVLANDGTDNSSWSEIRQFVLDTTAPMIDYDTGTSGNYANLSQSNIYVNVSFTETNFKNITFLLVNDTATVNSTTFTTATYEINWTGLTDGNYSYNVSLYDSVENFNSTDTRFITLDTIAPNINFTSPTPANNTYTSANSIYVNYTTNDTNAMSSFINYDNSLVGWWRMDDLNSSNDPVDYFGINNGSAKGGAVQTSSGKLGKAFSFDGVDDEVIIPDSSSFSPYGDGTQDAELSMCVWGYVNSIPPVDASFIDKGNTGNYEFNLGIESTTGKIDAYFWNAIGDGSYYLIWSAGEQLNDSSWHHICMVLDYKYDATGNLTLYKDGSYLNIDTTNASAKISDGNAPIRLGGKFGANAGKLNGTIDDVMIFNRSLSAEEITALYNSTLTYHNFTSQSDGTHTFQSYVQDIAGNVNNTELRQVTVDTTYSLINLILPAEGYPSTTTSTMFTYNVTDIHSTNCSLILNGVVIAFNSSVNISGGTNSFTNSTPVGSYTWNVNCTDASNNIANSSSRSFTISAVPVTPSGRGGGGGGSAVINPLTSLKITPSSLDFDKTIGIFGYGKLRLENTENKEMEISISLSNLNEIVALKNKTLKLGAGESTIIEFDIITPKVAGIYTGQIILKSNARELKVPFVLNVQEGGSLFDVSIYIPDEFKTITNGNKLIGSINLIQAGTQEKVDVVLNYIIKDFAGKTYTVEHETFAVYKEKSYNYEFQTQELPPGDYVLGIELIYANGVATSSSQFKVLEKSSSKNIMLWGILIAIILVVLMLIVVIKRYKKKIRYKR